MPFDFENMDYTVQEPKLRAYLARFRPSHQTRDHKHTGIEFIYLTAGRLEFTWDGRQRLLRFNRGSRLPAAR